jgi:hypothetical protein
MSATRPDYRQGRIVWACLRTAKGKREEHPAVILSPDSSIVQPEDFDPRTGQDNVIVVAGISTKYRNHPNPYVPLPFRDSANGHPVTQLRKDCAAIVGWYQAIFLPDDVTALGGDVPASQMREFNKQVLNSYIAAVGNQYTTSLEMMAELRESLIRRQPPGP